MEPNGWIPVVVSLAALVVSIGSLSVAYMGYRSSGPRVVVTDHKLTARHGEFWLEVKVTNSGRSEIDIEGAWTEWLGAATTSLPFRLPAGSSKILLFQGKLPPVQYSRGSLTVRIGLGNAQTVLAAVRLSESDLAATYSYHLGQEPVRDRLWGLDQDQVATDSTRTPKDRAPHPRLGSGTDSVTLPVEEI